MKEKAATTKDITRHTLVMTEELAEAIGLIAHAIAKHSPNPGGLIDDLQLISEPDGTNNPLAAVFWKRFNVVMKGGITPTEH